MLAAWYTYVRVADVELRTVEPIHRVGRPLCVAAAVAPIRQLEPVEGWRKVLVGMGHRARIELDTPTSRRRTGNLLALGQRVVGEHLDGRGV